MKVWLYLSREEQEERFRALESDPLERWRVSERDWEHLKLFDRFVECSERLIEGTQVPDAPWTVVHGGDPRGRDLEVGTLLRDAILRRLPVSSQVRALRAEGAPEPEADVEPAPTQAAPRVSRPGRDQPLDRSEYQLRLSELRARLNRIHRVAKKEKRSTVLVFEGWDAAGKGGTIRRVAASLDARDFRVIPIAAPTDEERQHHYLWRFWRHLPRAGHVTIFDRSWYGRVLVERVEELASEDEWRRAYTEINEFERQLVDSGAVLCKFWLDITRQEQKRRFRAREESPTKQWKLGEEDWRNRARWKDYELAVRDMLRYTSGPDTPWTVVESIDKRFARVRVLLEVCSALEGALGSAVEDAFVAEPSVVSLR